MLGALLFFALVLVAIGPALIFISGFAELSARVEADLNHGADKISEYIAGQSDKWRFLSEKINSVIESSSAGRRNYSYRVLDRSNNVIVDRVAFSALISITRTTSLSDGINPVGRFELSHSLGPVLAETAIAAVAGLFLSGILTYLFIRTVLRFINATLQQAANNEKKMRYMEKLTSLGLLVGGIAHNFNNLLQPIRLLSETTMDSFPEHSRMHKNLKVINYSADQASKLVGQIMEVSRQDSPKTENLELRDVIERVLDLVRPTMPPSITMKNRLASVGGRVLVDRVQIESVILNLISNAIDSIDGKKGEIEIAISREDIQSIRATELIHLEPGDYMKITITDTGIGMSAETQSRIFEPFFSTKEGRGGTGLGLSTALSIIARHRGGIEVESGVGKGTAFHVYLPLVEENAA
jgi:signal transduction histidine kinase